MQRSWSAVTKTTRLLSVNEDEGDRPTGNNCIAPDIVVTLYSFVHMPTAPMNTEHFPQELATDIRYYFLLLI